MQLLHSNILYLLPLFLLVFYFIRLQQRERPADVSSLLLWKRMLKRITPPSPPPKKKWDLITILRALTFIILILSACGLIAEWSTAGTKDVIVMMDCSASMASRDKDDVSLYQKAINKLRSLCSERLSSHRITLVFNPQTAKNHETVMQGTPDQIIAKASAHQPVACKGDMTFLTEQLMQKKPVYFFTDHLPGVAPDLEPFLTPVLVGNTNTNIGWISLDITENNIFAGLRNFSSVTVETSVVLKSATENIMQKKITLAPGAEEQLILPLPEKRPDTLIVKHTARDALAFDNSVQAVRIKALPPAAAVYGKRNRFIEKALQASGISFRYFPDTSSTGDATGSYSLRILNQTSLPVRHQSPGTFYLLFAPAAGGGFVDVNAGPSLNDFRPEWFSRDSLFRNTDFRSLRIFSAQPIRTCGNAAPRMKYKDYIIAFEGTNFLYFTFTPGESTIARFPSFPILFANLAQALFQEKYSYFKTGEIPSNPYNSRGHGNRQFEYPGLYNIQGHRFAVNMLTPSESEVHGPVSRNLDKRLSAGPRPQQARLHHVELTGLLSAIGVVLALLCWATENRNV